MEYSVLGPLSQQKSPNCHNSPLHALQCPHTTAAILFRDVITDKAYLRNIYKPKNLAQLKEGIQQFWLTLTPEVCTQHIMHLKKVMPKVKEEEGGQSEF